MRFLLFFLLLIFTENLFAQPPKFTGVNFASAEFFPQKNSGIPPLNRIGAEWVALTPFAYMNGPTDPTINFPSPKNWWADKPNNLMSVIRDARKYKKKLVLKPHFWVEGAGWAGSLDFDSVGWVKFEKNYTQFIMRWAIYAEMNRIEMFCFATELKTVVRKRPEFFQRIIRLIRHVYHGKLLYAANWDDYQRFPFWDELDFIGVDAYFPITESVTPTVEEVHEIWKTFAQQLGIFALKKRKMIIFTEYGYRSIDRPVWKQWEIEWVSDTLHVNLQAQVNSYEGLFRAVWNEPWFAGGFLWKWYPEPIHFTGLNANSDYTPQNKPAEKTINKWYKRNGAELKVK
jgi:hypothetical protein